jgi:hypothetical protein
MSIVFHTLTKVLVYKLLKMQPAGDNYFLVNSSLFSGNVTPDQKEPTPFIIEWIPDILPKMRIGELRIKLEYGHQRNGQIEHRVWAPQQELPVQTIHVHEIG